MIFLDCDTPRFILRLYSLGFTPIFPYTAKKALLVYLFRHRNHFFLFSRPYRTVLIDKLFSSQVFLFLFSVQKHQFYKVASMKFLIFGFSSTSSRKSCCIFQKILLLRDENMFKIRLLYRILCRPTHKIDCCTSFFPSSKDDKSSKNPFCTEFLPPNASIIQSRQPAAGRMPQSSSRGSLQPRDCHS